MIRDHNWSNKAFLESARALAEEIDGFPDLNIAIRNLGITQTAKQVLSALASFASPKGGYRVFPSLLRISKRSGVSRCNIPACLRELHSAGLISWTRKGSTNNYTLRPLSADDINKITEKRTKNGPPKRSSIHDRPKSSIHNRGVWMLEQKGLDARPPSELESNVQEISSSETAPATLTRGQGAAHLAIPGVSPVAWPIGSSRRSDTDPTPPSSAAPPSPSVLAIAYVNGHAAGRVVTVGCKCLQPLEPPRKSPRKLPRKSRGSQEPQEPPQGLLPPHESQESGGIPTRQQGPPQEPQESKEPQESQMHEESIAPYSVKEAVIEWHEPQVRFALGLPGGRPKLPLGAWSRSERMGLTWFWYDERERVPAILQDFMRRPKPLPPPESWNAPTFLAYWKVYLLLGWGSVRGHAADGSKARGMVKTLLDRVGPERTRDLMDNSALNWFAIADRLRFPASSQPDLGHLLTHTDAMLDDVQRGGSTSDVWSTPATWRFSDNLMRELMGNRWPGKRIWSR